MPYRIPAGYDWKKFARGTVVRDRETYDVGHIVGFDRAYYEDNFETVIKVLWDDGEVRSTHPTQLDFF